MVVESDRIEADLDRICSSAEFAASPRLVRLLRFCVEQSRLNHFDNLKESTVGVAVFDRPPGYNVKADPIVRVTAARLRRKLEEFYGSRTGCGTVIEIPKGSYVALFHSELSVRDAAKAVKPEAVAVGKEVIFLKGTPGSGPVRRPWMRAVVAILAILLLIPLIWLRTRNTAESFTASSIEPLIALPGSAGDPAWSPDGATVAFAWNGGMLQPQHIYLLKQGASVPVRLTSSDRNESRPVWSPDGRAIALLRQSSRDEISIVTAEVSAPAGGSTERLIRTIAQPESAMNMTALDWSPDGKWLLSSEGSNGGGSRRLILISLADRSSRVITDPPIAVTGDVEARFSPDGRKIAFRRGGEGTLFVLSLSGNDKWQPVQLTELNSGVRGISWSRDGRRIYFGSQQNQGFFSLWSIPAAGGKPVPATPGLEALSPALNPQRNLVVVSRQQIDQNLWLYSRDRSREPRILVPSTAVESAPAFAPDGRSFAFVSSRSGSLEVWVSGLDDAGIDAMMPRKVTSLRDAKLIGGLSWSADGLSVVFSARIQSENGAWQTNIRSGATTALRRTDTYVNWPVLSANGGALYFVSNAEHAFRLWRQTGGQPETAAPLTPELITSFRMPGDRRYIYFVRQASRPELMRMDPATEAQQRVYTFPPDGVEISAWDMAAGRLFYLTLDASRCLASIHSIELTSGASTLLGQFPVPSVEHWQPVISASPDGQSVIVARTDRDDATLMAVHLH